MLAPGQYSEGMLRGLDYFVAQAGQRGIKVGWVAAMQCLPGCLPECARRPSA